MAVIFNEKDIPLESLQNGISIQRLITSDRVGSDHVETARWHIPAGGKVDFSVTDTDLSWAHILIGEAEIVTDQGTKVLTPDHFILLPPGISAEVTSKKRSDYLSLRN